LVDVTETEVERPKHGQNPWYSGKQKCHTIKTQIVICAKTKVVIAVFVCRGSTHDFTMWKKSIGVKVVKHIKIQADRLNEVQYVIKGFKSCIKTAKRQRKKLSASA